MKNLLLMCVLLSGLFLTSGCENNEILLSEKKLNNELTGSWKIVAPRPVSDYDETWTFANGVVTISSVNGTKNIAVTGNYSVDTKFSKAFIRLSGFNFPPTERLSSGFTAADLNRKWTLVQLDEKVLYISTTDDRGAIRSIECVKM
jgi:hypothetical protein